ncbi:CHASE3 domain-containing protein [Streptomyces durmitorensis]|uniref:histidine kinase n=1 Tax=Streptomyces durmitorensis TaxID=319947 RepID=A0ABY4Q547_9ACTN|nr:sensor histidine kinase [Streptomyces durmitorensis]UQT61350.1 CHASE3 domain-containing protein [Streptomyces durmitorensis]
MVLLVVVGTVVGARLLGQTADVTDQLTDRLQPARTQAYRLQAALVNQETGVRGYAITADRQFLDPYAQGKRDEAHAAARLRDLIGDRPRLMADLKAVQREAADWRRAYAAPLVADVTPGEPRAVAATNAGRGKKVFDRIRTVWATQNADLARAVEDGKDELDSTRTVRTVILGTMVAVFLLAGIALAFLVRTLVARPLEALRVSSRQVARGDFDHVITVDGPADLRAVAGDVEGMRQQMVEELEASRRQRDVLTQQAAELDAQAVELRRSNAELEQFAYVASHDLQEPLRKVASFCQLLEKRYGDTLDDRAKQYIDFAVDGAKRMQVLINDLLTFSRVGRLNDARVPVDLDQALTKALANLDTSVRDTGALVERPQKLPGTVGDPTLLTMLWQNLVGNAVKFHHPERTPRIRITCEEDEGSGTWLLCVTDNGIGIPEEFVEKVFVIFQRLHGRDAYGGTGIGLALCKKIVEHHGGHIWIDSGHTGGTRVCFTLPSDADADADADPDTAQDSASRTEEKALT